MLDPGQSLKQGSTPAVLWLDDLEPFLNQGVTLHLLREWQSASPGRIVAATYGGKGSELVAGSGKSALTTIASDVLAHAREIPLEATTGDELRALRSKLSAESSRRSSDMDWRCISSQDPHWSAS